MLLLFVNVGSLTVNRLEVHKVLLIAPLMYVAHHAAILIDKVQLDVSVNSGGIHVLDISTSVLRLFRRITECEESVCEDCRDTSPLRLKHKVIRNR